MSVHSSIPRPDPAMADEGGHSIVQEGISELEIGTSNPTRQVDETNSVTVTSVILEEGVYLSKIADQQPEPVAGLEEVRLALGGVASNLDARFVEAGTALARTYEIVEKLVSSLERVTHALDREGTNAAIENMRGTADRLMRLPDVQAGREKALGAIQQAGNALKAQIAQVNRTLRFLRICGLNIKVAAAGMGEFSDFSDGMFARLDLAEAEMEGIAREAERLAESVPDVFAVERRLAAECATIVPHVPERLANDAVALQRHQTELATRAERIADVAREVRTKVGMALGALQIGDITRQRIEHVVDGGRLLDSFLEEHGDIDLPAADAIRGHMLALLAAQAADAATDFQRETRLLTQSLHEIRPNTTALLELQDAGDTDGGQSEGSFLGVLERSVVEVESVTGQLREADARSQQMGNATSETARNLGERLKNVHRVKKDVEHMAWNTDLRCYRMGDEGRSLAVVASEIRGFSADLERISVAIGGSFQQLAGAAEAMADPRANAEAGQSLGDSLACIREGGRKMRDGLSGLDSDASQIADILHEATAKVDCGEVSETLAGLAARLAAFARPQTEFAEETALLLSELLASFARSYTMASERVIHKQFATTEETEVNVSAATYVDDDDDDDGLF